MRLQQAGATATAADPARGADQLRQPPVSRHVPGASTEARSLYPEEAAGLLHVPVDAAGISRLP